MLQPTDTGTFVVTNLRCLFIGSKRTTEWSFAKLVGFSLEGDDGMAVFNVSNRQKASGVLYGRTNEDAIEAVIAAAIAQFQGADVHRAFLGELEEAVADARLRSAGINHNALPAIASVAAPLPAPPPELPAPHAVSIPAGWHPDPSGKHQLRYWDGTQWTDHVANRP